MPATKHHAVRIQLNIVACPTYPWNIHTGQCYCIVFTTCHSNSV